MSAPPPPVSANNGRMFEAWQQQAETRPPPSPFSHWLITLLPATFFLILIVLLPPPSLSATSLFLSRVCMLRTRRRCSACSELFVQVVCSQSNSCRPIKLIPLALRLPIEGSPGEGATTPTINGDSHNGLALCIVWPVRWW